MAQSYLQSQLEDRGPEGGRGRATVAQNTWESLDTNKVVFFPTMELSCGSQGFNTLLKDTTVVWLADLLNLVHTRCKCYMAKSMWTPEYNRQ